MRRNLIILGSSGLAREMAMLAEQVDAAQQRWAFLGFIGATVAERGRDLGPGRVLGDDDWLLSQDLESDLIIGVGYPEVRARILAPYLAQGPRFAFPNLVHPLASVDLRRVMLGRGNVITAHVTMTCDIEVQDFNLLNYNSTIGHDCRIGSFNVVNPGANVAGSVRLAGRVLVGTGAQILENVSIGEGATIGAGAVVTSDVAPGTTVVGVPARPLAKTA
jgi:sugar O-acyltransferase (sialic acid O-acetyltransferase NeuD family)